jgi:trigger factor
MDPGPDKDTATGTSETSPEDTKDESLGTACEVEVLGPCKRRIKASVPAEKVRDRLDKSYDELSGSVQLPGFRRGRVPRRLLERRFGEELLEDVKTALLGLSFAEALKGQELRLLGEPRFENVQIAAEADFRYEAEFEVQPEFALPEYRSIEVDWPLIQVDEAEVSAEIDELRRSRSVAVPIDATTAGADDHFHGRYHLLLDGVKAKSRSDVSFCPRTNVLEVFAVEGLPDKVAQWDRSSGEPLRLDVVVPAAYPDELLRGKSAQVEFFVEIARTLQLPDLDDAFAKEVGAESLNNLRTQVRRAVSARKRRQQERSVEDKIVARVLELTQLNFPEDLIEAQRKKVQARREQDLLARGVPKDEVQRETEKLGQAAADELRAELKEFMVLEKIAEKEKIFVTEDDCKNRVQLMALAYGVPVNALREELRSSGRMEEIRLSLRLEKVRQFLFRAAKLRGELQPSDLAERPGEAGAPLEAPAETVSPETVSPETVSPETVSPETVSPETVSPETVTTLGGGSEEPPATPTSA